MGVINGVLIFYIVVFDLSIKLLQFSVLPSCTVMTALPLDVYYQRKRGKLLLVILELSRGHSLGYCINTIVFFGKCFASDPIIVLL